MKTLLASVLLCALPLSAGADERPVRNGFPLGDASIPADEILAGGPPRDGIPALDAPPTVPVDEAPWPDDAVVLDLEIGGEARAYPVALLNWHELVNDTLGDRPIVVSYCPLCGTGMVFDRRVDGETLSFGVSGLLYRSDVLLYDRQTESLWSQILSRAVTGPHKGERLTLLRSRMRPLSQFREKHPEGTVLSRETGHRRNYDRSPYGQYASSGQIMFPVPIDRRYHPKMPTLGLRVAGAGSGGEPPPARAYPAQEVVRAGGEVEERFAGATVRVSYDPDLQVFAVEAPEQIEAVEGYWFAWAAFHPETQVFRSPLAGESGGGQP